MAQAGIHPNYQLATITCACGASYETASTRGNFQVEICARCHPFYTGRQKLLDSAGRIERFQKRYQLKPGTASIAPGPEKPKTEAAPKAEKADKPEKSEKAEKPAKAAAEKPAPAKPAAAPDKPKAEGAGPKTDKSDKGAKPKA
jgi:large subunit ribosomal protein L31